MINCYNDEVVAMVNPDLLPKTLNIECSSICLNQKSIDLEIQIPIQKFVNIDTIIINSIKFKKDKDK